MSRKQLAEKYIIKQWGCQWLIKNGERKCFINIPKLATYFQSSEKQDTVASNATPLCADKYAKSLPWTQSDSLILQVHVI